VKSPLLVCPFTICFFLGCSTTSLVPRDSLDREFAHARRAISGHTGVVRTTEGRTFDLDSLALTCDSLGGYVRGTRTYSTVPLSSVDEISFDDKGDAALRGALIGAGGGAALWATLGLVVRAKLGGPSESVPSLAGVGAVISSPICAFYYMINESARYYRFTDKHPHLAETGDSLNVENLPSSEVITLKGWPLEDETPESLRISWNGKHVWLPKASIKVERLPGNRVSLAIPKELLEASDEK